MLSLAALLLAALVSDSAAADRAHGTGPKSVRALRALEAPRLDGRLTEPAWTLAPVAGDFTQNQPRDGQPAVARTEARVVFASDAVYVGIRAFTSPSSVVAPLTRRDVVTRSDYVHVLFDTFRDRRTAFEFAVNPAGVKVDVYHFDDTQSDTTWDAVWDVAVARDSNAWTAEFRIPLSQLRYATSGSEAAWGVNFYRRVAGTQEWSSWAAIPQGEQRLVSRFGDLTGIDALPAPRRREFLPYLRSSVTRAVGDRADPLFTRTARDVGVGMDAKIGLLNGFTLDLTVRPDFGQVEADPSELNLSGFETAFLERRPFFVENGGLFQMSIYENPGEVLFYPRRVGRAPRLEADARGGFAHVPRQTDILTAAKVSGRTLSGWSAGFIEAITEAAHADVVDAGGGRHRDLVEPATNYSVSRVQKDLRAGRSAVGAMVTATNRLGAYAADDALHSAAYAGALDFRHRFGGSSGASHETFGALFGSTIRGSRASIATTQLSNTHLFQRSDASHLTLDSTRTSMTGAAMRLQVHRIVGRFRWGNALYVRTPDFDVNDAGIQRASDWSEDFAWIGVVEPRATRFFNNYWAFVNSWAWHTMGGERIFAQSNVDFNAELRSFWGGFVRVGRRYAAPTLRLRGGPLLREDGTWVAFTNLYSPMRNPVRVNSAVFLARSDQPDTWSAFVDPTVTWRPSGGGRVSVALGTRYAREMNDAFYVAQASTSSVPRYVVGQLDQTTLALTTRLDLAFTRDMTLQLYGQPFVSAASYRSFKEVVAPRAAAYAGRFRAFSPARSAGTYRADLDANGSVDLSFDDPAANVKEFRSNAVFRWEFRPGSTLFAVWSQARHRDDPTDPLRLSRAPGDVFRILPENVFLVKWSWWIDR